MTTIRKSNSRSGHLRNRERGKLWGQRSQVVQRARRMARGPDADTLHWQSREDARGMVLREGHTYSASCVRHWQITISRVGRIDQQDVIVDGVLWRTGGPRSVRRWLGKPLF